MGRGCLGSAKKTYSYGYWGQFCYAETNRLSVRNSIGSDSFSSRNFTLTAKEAAIIEWKGGERETRGEIGGIDNTFDWSEIARKPGENLGENCTPSIHVSSRSLHAKLWNDIPIDYLPGDEIPVWIYPDVTVLGTRLPIRKASSHQTFLKTSIYDSGGFLLSIKKWSTPAWLDLKPLWLMNPLRRLFKRRENCFFTTIYLCPPRSRGFPPLLLPTHAFYCPINVEHSGPQKWPIVTENSHFFHVDTSFLPKNPL